MKVVQINATCGAGSTGRTCVELAEALWEKGHDCTILYGNGSSEYLHGIRVSSDRAVKINGLLARLTGLNAAFSRRATRNILRQLKQIRPDIVHLRNLHSHYVNLNRLLKYLADNDIATVLTLHDCWPFTGKCTHYTADGCSRWEEGCRECPRLKKDIPSWFFDRTPRMWRDKKKGFLSIPRLGVTGVSDWITEEARRSFLGGARILRRIYNWIDLTVFCPRTGNIREKYGIPDGKFLILCIGAQWSTGSSKYSDLLKLAEKMEEDMHLVLVGRLPAGQREIAPRITSIGYVQDTGELARLYSVADVYVHLSREDTFGKVIAEALACGTPAVVYRSTACPELIGPGCGYIAEPGDMEQVGGYIRQICREGKAAYTEACLSWCRSHFDKDRLVQETIDLYRELL